MGGSIRHRPGESGQDRYERGELLGRGAYGEVRRGQDRHLGREVAIKVLSETEARDPDLARRLQDEARLGGRLQHPGVVPVYDLGTDDEGHPFLVMRLVGGESLADRLAQRESPADDRHRFLRIFVQLGQATAYAHDRGVVHRDLRPEHVRIGAFGEAQVLEWGRATSLSGGEKAALARRLDEIALGAILHEILTGAPPPTDGTHLAGADVEPDLADLCRQAVAPRPEKRLLTAHDLADGVEAHLAAAEERAHRARVRAARARAEADDQRRARRHAIVVIAVVLVLLGAGGLTVRAIERDRSERARRAARALDGALEAATARQAAGDGYGAEAAAVRALELAGDGEEGRRRRAAALLTEIREAREAARLRDERARRDAALLATLEIVRARGQAPPGRVDDLVRAAFHEAGLDVDEPEEAAGELSGSALVESIAAALLACDRLREPDGPDLCRLADLLDPDEERRAIRTAIRTKDEPGLRELAIHPGRVPPSLAGILGRTTCDVDTRVGLAFLRRVQIRHPSDPWTNFELAATLVGQPAPPWTEILRFASAAAALRPDNPVFRTVLGRAMLESGDPVSAHLTARELVHRFPDFAPGHTLRGSVLFDRGDHDGAIAAYREAIRLDDELPHAHGRLAQALLQKGRFAEALATALRGRELALAHPRWRRETHSERLVADCERYLELEKDLDDIVTRRKRPRSAAEARTFARLCRAKEYYATAARIYERVFRSAPGRSIARRYPRRGGPIECAVLAGCGRGKDAALLDDSERKVWRERALAWMTARRDDLARTVTRQGRAGRGDVIGMLRRWREVPHYACVREPDDIAKLPEAERADWRAFWSSVDERIERLGGW